MVLEVKNDTKIRATFYSEKQVDNINLGDEVTIYGDINEPYEQTNPNLFSYRNYLKSKEIYFTMNVQFVKKNKTNKNIFYGIKNYLRKIISDNPSFKYLYLFILGDNRYLDDDVKNSYQKLGISHLFSVSGMHISIISSLILVILKKIKLSEEKAYLGTCLFIILYMFLVSFCPSVLRSGLFFIFLTINNIFYFHIEPIHLLLLVISLILFNNPFIIYNTGFLYSSIITASLILFGHLINHFSNYFLKLLMTSLIAFCFSLPISLYNYYQFNILTIIYNLLFVPFVSIIIFPLSLICLFIRPLSVLLNILINLLENISLGLSLINSNIIMIKPSLLVVLVYYLLIYIVFKYHKKIFYFIFILFFLIHYNYNILFPSNYLLAIDIGQGDSILLHSGKYNILVDTGGNYSSNNLSNNTLIPLFKSLGIRKIDYLFLTHGDYDHVGETINLVNNFKIDRVYFNEGGINSNEKRIIDVLDRKNIFYDISKRDSFYKIGNYQIYSLNSDLGNENDSSLILYGKVDNNSFLLMGDASKKSEELLMKRYDIGRVDVLKVGHHGSITSSSKSFIDRIKPRYSIISVGEGNKYGHPDKEVLDVLVNSQIYRTDQDGGLVIKMRNNMLDVEWYRDKK